jgi:antitoxin VapB
MPRSPRNKFRAGYHRARAGKSAIRPPTSRPQSVQKSSVTEGSPTAPFAPNQRELAELTGENLTAAVTVALQERLDRVRRQRGASLADRLLAIGRDCAAHLKEPYRSVDHAELLYDELGLPR